MVYHRTYCLFNHGKTIAFDSGGIRLILLELSLDPDHAVVTVFFENGDTAEWDTKWITPYIFAFGTAVSSDGKYVFAQTWENGLLCLDAHTGERVWKTKSRRGITNVFVNEQTVLCHQRERALQLLDIPTGEVIAEKRPATAWGFTAIDHKHIVCQVTAKRWEIIEAETLETKAAFSHRDFTGGHLDYCVDGIVLDGNILTVHGFKEVWDDLASPAINLPNLEFEHHLTIGFLA